MTDQTDPTGKTFEARIRGLLELLGYRVQHDRLVAGRQTDLVGKYSPDGDSPYGVVDMAGNVWEMTILEEVRL